MLAAPDLPTDDVTDADVEAFAAKWSEAQATEIANAQSFLLDLCDLLGVPTPEPATKDPARDGYVFEQPVENQAVLDEAVAAATAAALPHVAATRRSTTDA